MRLPGFIDSLFSRGNIDTLDKVEGRLSAASGPEGVTLTKLLDGTDDGFFLWLLTDGYGRINSDVLRSMLPVMPDEETQANFTGKSGKAALKEAFDAFSLFKGIAAKHSVVLDGNSSVLDFGCGWGRIIRFFASVVEPSGLYGVDANEQIIDLCRRSNIGANFEAINPMPPTRFPAGTFDVIYLYSVFSHLSEEACDGWLAEFRRILKPGGVLIATTRPRSFIVSCSKLRRSRDIKNHVLGAARAFPDTKAALADYDDGKFCFSPGSSRVLDKGLYGEAAIPRKYVEKNWARFFPVVDFIEDDRHGRFDQSVIIARKDQLGVM